MSINFNPEGQEILEINNLVYDIMPSDITVLTDNALKEDVYFRSKGAFTFRSKHSESEVILSFPIPLLNPDNLTVYPEVDQKLFNNGINLISQLANFPFCFVRSARVYSYIGVSYTTPNDYLMFGVSNLKITQDIRIPGMIILEVKLLLHNPSNLVRNMSFATDVTINAWKGMSQGKSVKDIKDSPIFTQYMESLTGSVMAKYRVMLHELGVDFSNTNLRANQSFSNVVIKMPYPATVDSLKVVNNNKDIVLDITPENEKYIEYSDFKMYDRFDNGDRTFDGSALKEFQATYEDDLNFMTHRDLYLQDWRMYYLADRDIFNSDINAIQSITISKDNAFATHFVGSAQHGYLQFLGQYPARMSITSVYNSKGSYEYNQESSYNLFKVLLNSVDSNNINYPGASAYNHLKVKCIGSALLGISGMLPGECQLTAASEAANTEVYTTTFVENSIDRFIEDSKVRVGREIVSTKQQSAAILSIDLYINSISAAMGDATKDKPFNYPLHSKILHNIAMLSKEMHKEMLGNGQDTGVSKIEGQGIASLPVDYFDTFISDTDKTMNQLQMMKVLPKAKRTVGLLGIRAKINESKMSQDPSKDSNKVVQTKTYNEKKGQWETKTVSASEVYNFSSYANTLIDKISYDISLLKEGGFLKLKETDTQKVTDISDLNNQFLFDSFVGEAHKDLGLDLYIKNQSYRRRMNPFFFVKADPILQVEDYHEAMKLVNTDTVKQMKTVINREIGKEGLLEGFGSSTDELFWEMGELQEARYNEAKDAADDPSAGGTVSSIGDQTSIGNFDGNYVTFNTPGGTDPAQGVGILGKYPNRLKYLPWFAKYGKLYNIDPILLIAQAHAESHFNVNAVSPVGAKGMTQFMPATWRRFQPPVKNFKSLGTDPVQRNLVTASDPEQSIIAQARYMRILLDMFGNNWKHAVAGYNAGEGRVIQYKGIPPFKETQNYVIRIGALMADYKKVYGSSLIDSAASAANGGTTKASGAPKTLSASSSGNYTKASGRASTSPSKTNNNGTPSKTSTSKTKLTQADVPKAGVITVKVISVIDGDTITVSTPSLLKGKPFDVRVAHVDTPETDHRINGVITPSQYYAPEAKAFAISQVGNKTVALTKMSVDVFGRMLAEVGYSGGKNLSDELIKGGYALTTSSDPYRRSLEAKALADKKGMWKQPNRVIAGSTFSDNLKAGTLTDPKFTAGPEHQPKDWNGVGSAEYNKKNPSKGSSSSTTSKTPASSQGAIPLKNASPGLTNNFKPYLPEGDRGGLFSGYGVRSGNYFHRGLDWSVHPNAKVIMPTSGVATIYPIGSRGKSGYGNRIEVACDAMGFTVTFSHLNKILISNGRVSKGQVVGLAGNTGGNYAVHIHHEVLVNGVKINPLYTTHLDLIPKNVPINVRDYVAKQAFLSDTPTASWKKGKISMVPGGKGLYDGTALATSSPESSSNDGGTPQRTIDDLSMEEVQGYSVEKITMDQAYSVFNEDLQIEKHIDKMFSNFELGMNISFPIVKAYVTIGNEADDLFTADVPLSPILYFELPTLHDLNVVTNNDYNPVDVCTFSMINPNSIRSSTDYYGDSSFGANIYNMDTQYYNVFYGEKIKLKAGMKIHIRAGYSNAPGELKTIFNGIVVDTSGSSDTLVHVQCESFGAELLHNSMGATKPYDLSGGKNASTGLLIAYSLLTDNINHFGSSPSTARTYLAILKSLYGSNPAAKFSNDLVKEDAPGTEESLANPTERDNSLQGSGDIRDPENKPLIMPVNFSDGLSLINISRANLSSRLFTNIHCDAIDMAHDQYRSTFFTRISKGIQWFDSKWFYNYYVFRSTSWSVLKEMEYRHPGTLAKPLWFEDRMTMFFGIKEQLYVAKDLPAKFMYDSGIAGLAKNIHHPYSEKYLKERHKRLEPATGFHLLSSKLNILDNNLALNREFATRIHTSYYDSKYEGNFVQADAESVTVDLDDNLVPFDIREEVISLNGCHGKYSAWVYSIQELKKQAETMYSGTITVTGKPDMRAGDYAYLEDSDRGFSGVIKIRECSHHFSTTSGYTTIITPGLHVECTQFYWSTLFTQLGMAAKILLLRADISISRFLTSNKIAESYVQYLKIVQSNQKLSPMDKVVGGGGSVVLAGMTFYMLRRLLLSSKTLSGISHLPVGYSPAQLALYVNRLVTHGGFVIGKGQMLVSNHITSRVLQAATKVGTYGKDGLNIATNSAKLAAKIKSIQNLKTYGVLKAIGKVPWGLLKGVGGAGAVIGRGLVGFAFTNPISAILYVVGTLLFSVVMSKFRGLELTHNPLLMYPLLYNGKPYVAGISGYDNNSITEAWMKNFKTNMKNMRKASHHLRASTAGTSKIADAQANLIDIIPNAAETATNAIRLVNEYIVKPLGDEGF